MDNIFGIGLPELVLILVIAGMVMGPERIVRTARSLGALTARLQTISRTFVRQLNAELDTVDETGQIKSTVEELDQLRRQVADLKKEVFTLAAGPATEIKQITRGLRLEDENTIMPPALDGPREATDSIETSSSGNGRRSVPHQLSPLPDDESSSITAITAVANNHNVAVRTPGILPKRVEVQEDPDR